MLRHWGPGLVLTASVVGSGELIATTSLGSRVGYLVLWIIILSCFIKVSLQLVIGRYALYSGETTLRFLNQIPGPRLRASWVIWLWLAMMILVSFQQGAMLAGVAQVLNLVIPQLSVTAWAAVTAVVTILLLRSGKYSLVETLSTAMVVSFTFATITCVAFLQRTVYAFSTADLWQGLEFQLPPGGAGIAMAVFGITGIGATELIYYPYWCIEKGYARSVGVQDNSAAWYSRARGWIRTMNWDAFLSMLVYTVVTLAFYLLGASVLHSKDIYPEGMEMVKLLSNMYTQVLGMWAFYLFLLGAFFVLYSTIFVSVAANARLFIDCFHIMGLVSLRDYPHRQHWIRWLVTLQPPIHFMLFLTFQLPLWMVLVGGTAQSLMLPVIAFATLYLRYRRLDERLKPSTGLDLLLWISCICIVLVSVYGITVQLTH